MLRHTSMAVLALAMALGLSGTARADDRGHDRDGYRDHPRGGYSTRDYGYDRGYRDGLYHGREDRGRRVGYSYKHSRDYKSADRGYRSHMGSRGQYRKGYREGYRRGYDDGYRGRGGVWGGIFGGRRDDDDIWERDRRRGRGDGAGGRYDRMANDYGYRDGVWYARRDAANRKRYDPRDAKGYKDADRGYHNSYGDKDWWKQNYRSGFLRGYEEGYRGF